MEPVPDDQHAGPRNECCLNGLWAQQKLIKIPSKTCCKPVSVSLPPGSARPRGLKNLATLISLGYDVEVLVETLF